MISEKQVHYVCAGTCGAVSHVPKNCGDESCSFYGLPMHECHCEDGFHRQDIPANPAPAAA